MRIATLVVAALLATVVVASAQAPYIAVYFDPYHTQETKNCPGFVTDTWYVAAVNFNVYVTGADFMIQYPPAVTWLADLNVPQVKVGATPTGITMGWPLPLNGFGSLELCQVLVMWNCDHCDAPFFDNFVKVVPNPATMFLGVSDYPNYNLIPGVGLTSVICPLTVPNEDTTWGQVKALYE
jgi:hypothetical protein